MKAAEILDKLSATKKNKIAKLNVREVQQQADGSYIAFVDDDTESFDVCLTLKNTEVTSHSCDCGSAETFCIHKTALLLNITDSITAKTPGKKMRTKKAAKLSPAQQILQDLSLPQITSWLHDYFSKNKEAEMMFLLEFSAKTINFEIKEIQEIIQKAFTSVMAKRKKIELNELKKIIQYLEQSLEPVFQYMQSLIAQEKAFLFLEEIIISLNDKYHKYTVPGTRLQKYQLAIVEKYTLMLNNLQDSSLWKAQIDFLMERFFNVDFGKGVIVTVVANMYANADKEQRNIISSLISRNLNEFSNEDFKLPLEAEKVLLQIVVDNGDLKSCHAYFTTYPYENGFNIMLLEALKDIDPDRVLHYCYQAVALNTKAEYNVPYLKIMEHIMEVNSMPNKHLAQVKHDLFSMEPSYEAYAFIQQYLDDRVYLQKFRNNVLGRLRNMFSDNDAYKKIYLQILAAENNYVKMQEVVKVTPMSLELLKPYIEKLMEVNRQAVLTALANHVVNCCIESEQITDFDTIRMFVKEHFASADVMSVLITFWNSGFYYYPESMRIKFFKVFE